MTQAERKALALARRRFRYAERRRVTVAQDYAEAVRSYQRKRSPASRALAYRDVERQYARALEATERRELARRAYEAEVRRVLEAEQRRRAKHKPKTVAKRKPKAVAKRKPKEEVVDPAGTEYELTATTEGGSPSKGRGYRDPRVLHLKIRVILDRPMSPAQARALLDAALRRRQAVTGITMTGIDWSKGQQSGTAEGTGADLRRFYGAITKGSTRFARVKGEES